MSKLIGYGLHILIVTCIGMSVVYGYGLGIGLILQDKPVTMYAAVVVFSPVMMLVWRLVELKGNVKRALGMFDPGRQSWAFMFGDTFLLSYALLVLTRGWQSMPAESWFHSVEWAIWALWTGFGLSLVFVWFDRKRYIGAGVESALYSPTKLWHDYAVFPVLLGLLLFTGVPQLLGVWTLHTAVAVVAVLLFVGLCAADAVRDKRGTLKPEDQHFAWDPVESAIVEA